MALTAFALNCSLKGIEDEEKSSTDVLLRQVLDALGDHDVTSGDIIRAVDHDIKPGVKNDEGRGDAWPGLLKQILAADIFVIGTPIWLGQPSSVCKRVLERLDAMIDDMDDRKRMKTFNRVALVAVVGNEDGAHHVCGRTLSGPVRLRIYDSRRRHDLLGRRSDAVEELQRISSAPDKVAVATAMAAANAAHLARLLSDNNYPGVP